MQCRRPRATARVLRESWLCLITHPACPLSGDSRTHGCALESLRLAQRFVDAALPAGASLAEILQYVRVQPQVDGLLRAGGFRPPPANHLVAVVKVRPLEPFPWSGAARHRDQPIRSRRQASSSACPGLIEMTRRLLSRGRETERLAKPQAAAPFLDSTTPTLALRCTNKADC